MTCRNFGTADPAAPSVPATLPCNSSPDCGSGLSPIVSASARKHHIAEGFAQARRAVGGNARRRHDRKPDIGDATEQLQHDAVEVVTGKFGDRRHVGQLPAAPHGDGIKEVDLAGFDPIPSCQDIA